MPAPACGGHHHHHHHNNNNDNNNNNNNHRPPLPELPLLGRLRYDWHHWGGISEEHRETWRESEQWGIDARELEEHLGEAAERFRGYLEE